MLIIFARPTHPTRSFTLASFTGLRPDRLVGLLTAAVLALAALPAAAQPAGTTQPTQPTQPRPPRPDEPTSLTAEQQARVKTVLAPYKPANLTADDAKAIKRAFRDAGLQRSVVLDKAITAAGFSPERLEALDPRPAQPPPGAPPSANGAPVSPGSGRPRP